MPAIDIKKVLNDLVTAMAPVQQHRGVRIVLHAPDQPIMTSLPLDEVVAPMFYFVMRLLYLVPSGRDIRVGILTRKDGLTGDDYLQIEIRLYWFTINPTILLRPEYTRFRIEHDPQKTTRLYMEWLIPPEDYTNVKLPKLKEDATHRLSTSIEPSPKTRLHHSKHFLETSLSRWEEYGSSAFIKEKLNGTKSKKDVLFMNQIHEVICKHLADPLFDTEELCRELGLSRVQLYRRIKALTGYSTANFIRHSRLHKAAEMLRTTTFTIAEIADKTGFNEPSYFSSSFQKEFHLSPSYWRKEARMEQ